MRLAAFALLALFASAALAEPRLSATGPVPDYGNPEMSSSGQPVCVNGDWTEVAKEEISAHRAVPEVQCWRKPPCIRWSYLDRVKCTKCVALLRVSHRAPRPRRAHAVAPPFHPPSPPGW